MIETKKVILLIKGFLDLSYEAVKHIVSINPNSSILIKEHITHKCVNAVNTLCNSGAHCTHCYGYLIDSTCYNYITDDRENLDLIDAIEKLGQKAFTNDYIRVKTVNIPVNLDYQIINLNHEISYDDREWICDMSYNM